VRADFRLHAFCMDEESLRFLQSLRLPHLVAVPLKDLERYDPALLSVKPTRTTVEYFWTATPSVCLYVLDREPDVAEVTYLDADLLFFSDPAPLFAERGDDSVMIVPHRYAPQWESLAGESGTYNVQFMSFRRTP